VTAVAGENDGQPNGPAAPLSSQSTLTTPLAPASTAASSSKGAGSKSSQPPSQGLQSTPTSPGNTSAGAPTASDIAPTGHPKSGITGGAAAGIAIGCLIAGALIASVIFFLLRKRRGNKGVRSVGADYADEKNPHVSVQPVGYSSSSIIESNLPQPAEDRAIANEISILRDRIKSHVKSYYDASIPKPVTSEAVFQDLPLHAGISAARLAALINDPASRAAALQYCVAAAIIDRIELDSDPNISFLPFEISMCMQKMNNTNIDGKGMLQALLFQTK
jgi:hypothetical protein